MRLATWYTQHGLWNIAQFEVTPDRARIAFVLSRNDGFKMLLVSTVLSTNRKEDVLWSKEGVMRSKYGATTPIISWNDELNICAIGHSPDRVELFQFRSIHRAFTVSQSNENMHRGQYVYDPDIKYLRILHDQMTMVTLRGILCGRQSAVPLLSRVSGINEGNGADKINLIHGDGTRFIILPKSPKHCNRMILFDGTQSFEVKTPNHAEWRWHKDFVRVIGDRNLKRIVLQNGERLYMLETERKESEEEVRALCGAASEWIELVRSRNERSGNI